VGVNSQTQIIVEVTRTKVAARVSPVCPLCGSSQAKALFAQRGYRLMSCGVCELFFIDPYPRDIDRQHEVVATYAYEDFQLLKTAKHYEYEVNFYRNYFELIEQECVQATSRPWTQQSRRSVCAEFLFPVRSRIAPDSGNEIVSGRADFTPATVCHALTRRYINGHEQIRKTVRCRFDENNLGFRRPPIRYPVPLLVPSHSSFAVWNNSRRTSWSYRLLWYMPATRIGPKKHLNRFQRW
jgi:hypothetical protein